MDGWKDGRTDGWMGGISPHSTGLRPLLGPLPKNANLRIILMIHVQKKFLPFFARATEGLLKGCEGLLEGFEGLLEGSEGWLEGSEGQPAGSEGQLEGSGGQPAGSEGQPEGGRTDVRTDGRTYGRTDGRNFSPFYRTSSPVGAAAQKPKIRLKQVFFFVRLMVKYVAGMRNSGPSIPTHNTTLVLPCLGLV